MAVSDVKSPPPPAATSCSTITATVSTGCHVLTISGYSATKLYVPGQRVESRRFTAAGHAWRICYYPNGHKKKIYDDTDDESSISFFLKMADGGKAATADVRAAFRFSLVPRDGVDVHHGDQPPPASTATKAAVTRFAGNRRTLTFPRVRDRDDIEHWGLKVAKKELEKSPEYLDDGDSIVVRCEIAVVEEPVASGGDVERLPPPPPVCTCKVDHVCELHQLKATMDAPGIKETFIKLFFGCIPL